MSRIKKLPRRARDLALFVYTFARDPLSVGAIFPSSRSLAHALSGDLSAFSPGDVVVEFGPGTGAITRAIAEKLPEGVRYVGIERDPKFHALLCKRYPKLDFEQGDAQDISRILSERGFGRADRIISGLPFAFMPGEVQRDILRGVEQTLRDGGDFRTFQYMHSYGMENSKAFRQMMQGRFERAARLGPVYKNVPPAWILVYGDRPDSGSPDEVKVGPA